MGRTRTKRWAVRALCLLACWMIVPAPGAAQEPGLTLEEVYDLARRRSPILRAASAAADAGAAREPAAGTLPDPVLQLGVVNFSVPGLDADMPNSMAPSVQLTQPLPFPGKLGLRGRIAKQSTTMARETTEERWWRVRNDAAAAFYRIYELDHQIEVARETLGLLDDFQQVAKALYAAGTGRQSDVLRAGVEVARMDTEVRRMTALRTAAAARLNALLDRPAETPVPTPVLPSLPAGTPAAAELRAWAEESRPLLRRTKVGVEQAATREDLARKEIWPDLSIGIRYGERSGADGRVRMGSALVGFSIPIHAGSRQLRLRDEAAAMASVAQAELTDARARIDAGIRTLLAELDRARTLVAIYRAEVLPQAEANVESSFSSYRVGSVDFLTLVDAQMSVNRYEQELFTLLADYGRAVAELEAMVGRTLPVTAELTMEDR